MELVTCSADKSLKTWSLSCRKVANHYYGHASEVNCIDLLQGNKPITGGSDGTLRNWKVSSKGLFMAVPGERLKDVRTPGFSVVYAETLGMTARPSELANAQPRH